MPMSSAETHIGEDLSVNQCWDARSDCIVVFGIFGFGKKLDLCGGWFERIKLLFNQTINSLWRLPVDQSFLRACEAEVDARRGLSWIEILKTDADI